MPRSIWKGVISFGLVAIPIRVYLATESKSIHFRLLCPKHKEPIKMRRWCVEGEHEVAWNEALRGFEISKGRYVILDEKDLEKISTLLGRASDAQQWSQRAERRKARMSSLFWDPERGMFFDYEIPAARRSSLKFWTVPNFRISGRSGSQRRP